MTAALDRLERLGYVRRVRSLTDRRSVMVEITPVAFGRSRIFTARLVRRVWPSWRAIATPRSSFCAIFCVKVGRCRCATPPASIRGEVRQLLIE